MWYFNSTMVNEYFSLTLDVLLDGHTELNVVVVSYNLLGIFISNFCSDYQRNLSVTLQLEKSFRFST